MSQPSVVDALYPRQYSEGAAIKQAFPSAIRSEGVGPMPSPFPGMDPYLEDPIGWPDIHQGFITTMRAELNRVLPPQYRARMGERLYVVQPDRSIFPDAMVLE